MFRRRAVAHFAGNAAMIGSETALGNCAVAEGARLVPGVARRVILDGVDRRSAVVPYLTEGIGHEVIPRTHEASDQYDKDGGQTWNLLGHPHCLPCRKQCYWQIPRSPSRATPPSAISPARHEDGVRCGLKRSVDMAGTDAREDRGGAGSMACWSMASAIPW